MAAAAVSVLGMISRADSSGISLCRTGSYWVSATLHNSASGHTCTDAKGSVYDSLPNHHFRVRRFSEQEHDAFTVKQQTNKKGNSLSVSLDFILSQRHTSGPSVMICNYTINT